MFKSSARSVIASIILACGAGVLAGCAQPLSFSQDYKRVGISQYNSGEYLAAAGSFKSSAKENPADYQTQYYLGLSEEKNNEPQSAIEAYRLCLKLRPATPAGRFDVAMREKVLNRVAPLIARAEPADFEINAIQTEAASEKSAEDYRLLARVFALRGDADSAMDSYRRGFSVAPDDFLLAKEYGLYLLKVNQPAEGTRVLKLAWQINSTDRQVNQTLRDMGVDYGQLVVSNSRIESEPLATPQTAWDVSTAPKE
jgi:Tfp pilus assembly protein PilF